MNLSEILFQDYLLKTRNPDPGFIYLNSGTESLLPKRTQIFLENERRKYEQNPTLSWIHSLDRLWNLQTEIARFFNAGPEDFFLRHNVTEALNTFLLGVSLPEGSEILITSLEYGAIVNLCRFKAEKENLKLRVIDIPTDLETLSAWTAHDFSNYICKHISTKTSLLLASHVVTFNGLVLDVDSIAKHTSSQNIFFAVDGAHSIGQLDLKFSKDSKIDFYGGNFHKWMMGPKGTGFGWTNPKIQGKVKPTFAGWTSFEISEPFDRFGNGNPFALQQLMPGTRDFCSFYGLEDTLAIWNTHGASLIRKRLFELRTKVREEMQKKCPQFQPLSSENCASNLISFELPEKVQSEGYKVVFKFLEQNKIQLSFPKIQTFNLKTGKKEQRWCVRFSAHLWNNEAEIQQACKALSSLSS